MRKKNPQKMLSVLVDECGYDAVNHELEKLRPQPKPVNAVAVVALMDIDGTQKEALMTLAEKYDAKRFMHNIKNIQRFWFDMGGNGFHFKSPRPKAPIAIFGRLADWDIERLIELNNGGKYSPPPKQKNFRSFRHWRCNRQLWK